MTLEVYSIARDALMTGRTDEAVATLADVPKVAFGLELLLAATRILRTAGIETSTYSDGSVTFNAKADDEEFMAIVAELHAAGATERPDWPTERVNNGKKQWMRAKLLLGGVDLTVYGPMTEYVKPRKSRRKAAEVSP